MNRLAILALATPAHGGTFPYTLTMIEALRGLAEWDITVFGRDDCPQYRSLGLPVRSVSGSTRDSLSLAVRHAAGLKLVEPFADFDLVIAPIYGTILLHTCKPFIFTLHDMQERYLPENFSLGQRLWRGYVNGRLCARATKILCESQFVRDDLERFQRVGRERIEVVPSPPHFPTGAPDSLQRDAVRAKYALPQDYVFYPAQFWPHKNHRRLIEAFSRIAAEFPACELVLTGRKRDEYAAVEAEIDRLGLRQRVRHLGHVEGGDIPALYSLATVLVVPSLFESISIPVYEAFHMGTAVCCSNILAFPDQARDAALLFDPLQIDSIAAALRRALGDPLLRKELVARGKKRLDAISMDGYRARLDAILKQALSDR